MECREFLLSATTGMKEFRGNHYIVITFDLEGSSSIAYKEIKERLENNSFKRDFMGKDIHNEYSWIDLPANTYIALINPENFEKKRNYKNIHKLRDDAIKLIVDILEFQMRVGNIKGFRYFVFVGSKWSCATGSKKSSD
jgi:hypothetical protein